MESSITQRKDKIGWYPGKYLGRSPPATKKNIIDEREDIGEDNDRLTVVSNSNIIKGNDISVQSIENIGIIKVAIIEIKYLRINYAKLYLEVDEISMHYNLKDENFTKLENEFSIKDIIVDIKIFVIGKSDVGEPVAGVIIIPTCSLLNFFGKPISSKVQWFQLYPVGQHRISDRANFKFEAGYKDLSGYAMNRRKDPLGFVCVNLELKPIKSSLALYLHKGRYTWMNLKDFSVLQHSNQKSNADFIQMSSKVKFSEQKELNTAELCAKTNRDLNRIMSLLKLPLSLSPFLSLPEVFIFILVFAFICFSVSTWQIPLLVNFTVLINGIMTMHSKTFHHIIIWNEPIPPTLQQVHTVVFDNNQNIPAASAAAISSTSATSSSSSSCVTITPNDPILFLVGVYSNNIMPVMYNERFSELSSLIAEENTDKQTILIKALIQQNTVLKQISYRVAKIVNNCEIFCNLFNFSDPRVSVLVYIALSGISVLSSIVIIVSRKVFIAMLVTIVALMYASSNIAINYMLAKSSPHHIIAWLDAIAAFYSRVPNELELIHRYIASTALVNRKGSEMIEASTLFEARSKIIDRHNKL